MSKSARATGTIVVQETGAIPDITTSISPTTGVVSAQGNKKFKLAAAGTYTITLSSEKFATGASFLHIRAFDAITGLAKNFMYNLNAVGNSPLVSEVLLVSQGSGPITSVLITADAGNDTNFEVIIAGV